MFQDCKQNVFGNNKKYMSNAYGIVNEIHANQEWPTCALSKNMLKRTSCL